MYFTYIIESESIGKWYYGSTSNLDRRLAEHNDGSNISTRNRRPWKYVFVRVFEIQKEARDFELYLKKSRNKEYIKRQFSQFFV
ncbi:MAG TPA: GIY-YIG nuclease family protein [Cyclobacteriaceae bacterium]